MDERSEAKQGVGTRLRGLARQVLGGFEGIREQVYATGLEFERRRTRVQLSFADVGGERVAYLERPGSGPTVVLVHGFTANKDIWLAYIRCLPRTLRVVAPDLKGHGDNAQSMTQDYDARSLVTHTQDFLDTVVPEPFHLAGNSLGGLVSAGCAAEADERLKSLALFAPAGHFPEEKSDCFRRIEEGENPFLMETYDDYERFLELVFSGPAPMPRVIRPVLARDQFARRELHAKMWLQLNANRESLIPILNALTMPTLLLWGDQDRILHPASCDFFAEHLPNADVVRFEGGGHVPMLERPRETAALHGRLLG